MYTYNNIEIGVPCFFLLLPKNWLDKWIDLIYNTIFVYMEMERYNLYFLLVKYRQWTVRNDTYCTGHSTVHNNMKLLCTFALMYIK